MSDEVITATNGRVLLKQSTKELPVTLFEDNLEELDVSWHWQDEFEIGLVTDGEVLLSVESERFILKAGDGFFVNAGAINACCQNPDSTGSCVVKSVVFSHDIVNSLEDSIFYDNYIAPVITNNALKGLVLTEETAWHREIIRLIDNCFDTCLRSDEAINSGIRDIISQIIFLLAAHSHKNVRPLSAKEARDSERIRIMLNFIDEHYRDDLNVATLSESAEVSESEAMRCFHNMLGTTPIQYLKNYRIRKAAELLRVSEEKIVDIAIDCGFQDMSYFAKTFREAKGVTPTEYREKYRKDKDS